MNQTTTAIRQERTKNKRTNNKTKKNEPAKAFHTQT
jgi:hypothetical protein